MTEQTAASFLDRTLRNLRRTWRDISQTTLGVVTGEPDPDLPRTDLRRLRAQMRECLEARGGEASARARAAALGRTYLGLSPVGRQRFLRVLAADFDSDRGVVDAAMDALRSARGRASRRRAEAALRRALEPPRLRLLTQFNALPEGIKFLVDLRADLMQISGMSPLLADLEADLRGLLASWFDVGFLELRRITWDSPASLLEKLIVYEAVHEIRDWRDLKNRLDSDRRCFAFFHPSMPQEPVIFVEVALTHGLADSIQGLLDRSSPVDDPRQVDTAIFYSISNAQNGLAGISFGDFLIKRVVSHLAAEFGRLKTFATLSPAPGFRPWLDERLAAGERRGDGLDKLLKPAEREALAALAPPVTDAAGLKALLAREDWPDDAAARRVLKAPLSRLFGRYLLHEHRPGSRALDPVANFHFSNGARAERVNWLADVSPKGLQQSAGFMVNYLYKLENIESNHESYTAEGAIAASAAVRSLAKD